MAALTWRNVDAPNFSGALAGIRTFGDMLNNGTNAITQGLQAFRDEQRASNDQRVLAESLRFTDPDAYNAALQSGQLTAGVDPSTLSAGTLNQLGSRAGQLLDQASTRQGMDVRGAQLRDLNYVADRRQTQDGVNDAARPALAEIATAAASGDPRALAAAQQRNAGVLATLDPTVVQGALSNALGLDASNISNTSGRFRNGVVMREDAVGQEALAAADEIGRVALGTTDVLAGLEQLDNPAVRQAALARLSPTFGSPYGPAGGQPGQQGGGGFAAAIPFNETRNYVSNITAAAGNVTGTNREKATALLPHLIQQESGGRDNVVSSAGARGRTQVMPATGANPGFGVQPMQNQTPQEYERFATDYLTAMLDRYGGDTERALAAYNAGPGTVDTWNNEFNAAQGQLGVNRMANSASSGAANDLVANFGNNATTASVAGRLIETDFPGADRLLIQDQIESIRQRSADEDYGGKGRPTITPAQAGAILQRSLTTSGRLGTVGVTDVSGDWFGRTQGVNDAAVNEAIRQHNSGASLDQVLTNEMSNTLSQRLDAASQGVQSASQQLASVAQRARAQPELAERLPEFIRRREQAQQQLDRLLNLQRSSPAFQPR